MHLIQLSTRTLPPKNDVTNKMSTGPDDRLTSLIRLRGASHPFLQWSWTILQEAGGYSASSLTIIGKGIVLKDEYDFSKAKRNALDPLPSIKTRITIRIDTDILDWFRSEVDARGGGNYQTLINYALREYIQNRQEPLEEILHRVVREELHSREWERANDVCACYNIHQQG